MVQVSRLVESWKERALWVALASLVVAVASCGVSIWAVTEMRRQNSATLVVRESKYVPMGSRLATVVPLFNEGARPGTIQKVTFRTIERKRTPSRQALPSKGPVIPVHFTYKHYDNASRTFTLPLATPRPVPANGSTALQVAIVQPQWVGNTYTGVLTVHYDGGSSRPIAGVELDVLAQAPALLR